jgi:hypothetical protein
MFRRNAVPQHRRAPVWPLVRRSRYRALVRERDALRAEYRALEADLQLVLEDHEGLLYELGDPSPGQTRWGRVNEVVLMGLDPERAQALVRAGGMLESPSGYNGSGQGTTR